MPRFLLFGGSLGRGSMVADIGLSYLESELAFFWRVRFGKPSIGVGFIRLEGFAGESTFAWKGDILEKPSGGREKVGTRTRSLVVSLRKTGSWGKVFGGLLFLLSVYSEIKTLSLFKKSLKSQVF